MSAPPAAAAGPRVVGDRTVGPVGLGCMPMSHAYTLEECDDAASIRVVHRALDLGVVLFDTADIYGPYTNERLLGRALRDRRDEAMIATKAGLVPDGDRLARDGRPAHIRRACDASLTRLGTDRIDLLQLHRVDPEVPIEETWGAMSGLVTAGKVRTLGISHATVDDLARAHAVHPVAALQVELSIWERAPLGALLPWCARHGAAVLAFSPLGRGYLTGALRTSRFGPRDSRIRDPRFTETAMTANQVIVAGVRRVAGRHGATPAQVALAWALAQGPHVVPIPGTKKTRWLEENVRAAAVRLSATDLHELDALPEPRAG